jgi:hypothetical protein
MIYHKKDWSLNGPEYPRHAGDAEYREENATAGSPPVQNAKNAHDRACMTEAGRIVSKCQ